MTRTASVGALLVGILSVAAAFPAGAQLPRGDAGWLGTGGTSGALVRGHAALGVNPAALALSGTPRWSAGIVPGSVGSGLNPLRLRELARQQDQELSREVREAWLVRVAESGGLRGSATASLAPVALQAGPLAMQISSTAWGRARMNEDAVELLLFGNAGREGTAGDFALEGSDVRAAAYTTLSAGGAMEVEGPGPLSAGRTALGAAAHLTVGHGLVMGVDRESRLHADPPELELRFPLVGPAPESGWRAGHGFGIDLSAAWEGSTWSAGVGVRNALHTFRWNPGRLRYRSGEARFAMAEARADFDARPLEEAPDDIRAEVESMGFGRALNAAVAHHPGTDLVVVAQAARRFGGDLSPKPAHELGAGVEHRPAPHLPLRAGAAWIPGGYRAGAGVGLDRPRAALDGAVVLRSGDHGRRLTGALTLSLRRR